MSAARAGRRVQGPAPARRRRPASTAAPQRRLAATTAATTAQRRKPAATTAQRRKPAATTARRRKPASTGAREVPVRVRRTAGSEDLPLPVYATADSAGADIAACLDEPVVLGPGERASVATGLRIALPRGYEAEIRPRSGLAAKHGLTLLNAPGTIDADYRGEIKILLVNLGREPVTVRRGERIAQMLVRPVTRARFVESADLPPSARGEGGFGHTGV